MKIIKNRSFLTSLLLSVLIAVLVAVLWGFGGKIFSVAVELVIPPETVFTGWKAIVLICLAFSIGILAELFSVKRIFPYALCFLASWFCVSILSAKFLNTDVLFIPIFLTALLTLAIIHLKKMWLIDSELTEKLVALASTGHLLEGKSADLRIESGLKLLETVLPLSEAIIFRLTTDGELNPIGRTQNDKTTDSAVSRQSSWRENVGLCEESLQERQTKVQIDENKKGSARIAIPLIDEDVAIGVLFVKIHQNFERSDQYILEAFSGQLARNFQRKEMREKSLPHTSWWSSFSSFSAENRLDIINLVHGIIKEQSFSAIASSYLKEAHAIAYLDGTLAYMNRKMRQFANLNSQEFYNTDLFSLLERFKTDIFTEPTFAIRRVLQTGETYKSELYFPESGKTLNMQISLVKVPSDNQSIHETNISMKPACFLITFRDISAVKENEKLRSDMASLMSHELRTPITSIKGFAELLLIDENIPEEAREFLTIINHESERLSKMLSTFLSVSNLEQSDKQDVTKTPVKLDTVVHEVVGDMQDAAKRKRIRLVEQANVHLPPVAADKSLIRRAVSHLVDNAIKYSPERTSVIISTILESDFLRVVVEDRGYGIPNSDIDKIWQKFYRVARDGQ
ncbi:MAG: histidine kinase dimerization/phospho-acceptor domain-containing protein, partial [Pyrinomonadaceae bacterium]